MGKKLNIIYSQFVHTIGPLLSVSYYFCHIIRVSKIIGEGGKNNGVAYTAYQGNNTKNELNLNGRLIISIM